jgi:hypothetical protein
MSAALRLALYRILAAAIDCESEYQHAQYLLVVRQTVTQCLHGVVVGPFLRLAGPAYMRTPRWTKGPSWLDTATVEVQLGGGGGRK